jgi:hypothetical protein
VGSQAAKLKTNQVKKIAPPVKKISPHSKENCSPVKKLRPIVRKIAPPVKKFSSRSKANCSPSKEIQLSQ